MQDRRNLTLHSSNGSHDRLTPDEQGRVSEFAVGPQNDEIEDETAKVSNDLEKRRALVNDFVVALEAAAARANSVGCARAAPRSPRMNPSPARRPPPRKP